MHTNCNDPSGPRKRIQHFDRRNLGRGLCVVQQADQELREHIFIDDEDFNLDGISSDPSVVEKRLEDLIKWNPAADNVMRAAYSGDSRATKYRKLNAKEQRHESVANCPKIDIFFMRANPSKLLVLSPC